MIQSKLNRERENNTDRKQFSTVYRNALIKTKIKNKS